jgi:hypothetical protein
MSWKPLFKLYASNGSTLVYNFDYIQNIIGWPSDNPSNVEITNLRSQGSINIPGGQKSYDITLEGILIGTDYTDLTTKIFSLQTSIVSNTNYVLKIEKSSGVTDPIYVTRISPIKFEDSMRTTFQKYSVQFRALSW